MKSVLSLVVAALLPLAVLAQESPAPAVGPVTANTVTLSQFLWVQRPIVVFADTPNDPQFLRQMARIESDLGELAERDVVVITDTDPAAATDARQRLRPRGFALVLMDKDGEVKRRVPSAWTVREITHAIDRFPLRRQEMLEQRPAGR
ncbi:DUF4174 domain-containing protein [Tabrizicola sp. J26]|uniref:DUF4174 domain-containing protein n=1 Tax=Alitabrizicola rongguiensis TaxID=2909234 RepID=UPI001F461E16|nr:DUF4174 domain-containing protein [Tabrizicola rongguiensis]MCF1708873.1 DUF4174 domain-containing protein [Tabrizicola rongguiensis]